MKDFVLAALPFLIIGISIAIIIVNSNKAKGKKSEENTYIGEGMCLGMSLGILLGQTFAKEHLGIFLSSGMLVGEAIGSSIKKKEK